MKNIIGITDPMTIKLIGNKTNLNTKNRRAKVKVDQHEYHFGQCPTSLVMSSFSNVRYFEINQQFDVIKS